MPRRFIDAPAAERCAATLPLADGSQAQCGRRKTQGGLCTQHAKKLAAHGASPLADVIAALELLLQVDIDSEQGKHRPDRKVAQANALQALTRAKAAEVDISVEDVIEWADGIRGVLGTEYADRVSDREAAIAHAIHQATQP